ncbi:MAG: hypothetical protein Q9M94_04160 [Candidatus Gracilibacteria bacterium]|nr:hypothetical protein [Candidatus Gracilibacteria bacterium]
MKKTTIPKGIIQGLLFNIAIFILFIFLGISYFAPEYSVIEDKKTELNNLQKENSDLLIKGLNFSEFKKLYLKDSSINDYLKNIITDPSKDIDNTYKENLTNNGPGSYDEFILEKNEEIKNKETNLNNSQIKNKIAKILPSYKEYASLKEEGLTDFKFINYMEKIIHAFGLEYEGNIGVGSFVLEEYNSSNTKKSKTKTENKQEGEIYNFKLSLNIDGPKKNIIDFIYYLENVGYISFNKENKENKNIEIKQVIKEKYYIDENNKSIRNDFYNISRYFPLEEDIFNNLLVDIDSIKLKDYIDSSLVPIPYDDGKTTFIGFVKEDQTNEKYEVDLVLKFYVKGLDSSKTKKDINNILLEYKDLKIKIPFLINQSISELKNKQSKLLKKDLLILKKFNNYLNLISNNIDNLSDSKRLESELGNVYKESVMYKDIFSNISSTLDRLVEKFSEKNVEKYNKKFSKIKLKKGEND